MCTMPLTYVATDPKNFVRLISKFNRTFTKKRRREFDKTYIVF